MNPALARSGLLLRRGAFALLVLAMLLLHGLLAERLGHLLAATHGKAAAPRMQAAFVRELQPSVPAPPAPIAPLARAARAPAAAVPPQAASAPLPAPGASEPELPQPPVPEAVAPAAEPLAETLLAAVEPASAPALDSSAEAAAPAASVASAPGFAWPPSTRLAYGLTGYVRGEVHGTAQVQWIRDGARYQVHLDVTVGPGFAPLMQRRMTSAGQIVPQGLAPQRYDEETQIGFGSPRGVSMRFDADGVTLANGRRVPAPPGVQDTASQFVQLSYLFATGTRLLAPGVSIELPLALARRVDPWVYEVVGEESLHTPFGPLSAWHLKPQRVGDLSALSIEAWFAPSLQYLPVRIVLRQGAENHLDLMIERLPWQAAENPRQP